MRESSVVYREKRRSLANTACGWAAQIPPTQLRNKQYRCVCLYVARENCLTLNGVKHRVHWEISSCYTDSSKLKSTKITAWAFSSENKRWLKLDSTRNQRTTQPKILEWSLLINNGLSPLLGELCSDFWVSTKYSKKYGMKRSEILQFPHRGLW